MTRRIVTQDGTVIETDVTPALIAHSPTTRPAAVLVAMKRLLPAPPADVVAWIELNPDASKTDSARSIERLCREHLESDHPLPDVSDSSVLTA